MPRKLHDHAITVQDTFLHIHAVDEPGPNGDNHEYLVSGPGFSYALKDSNGTVRMQSDAVLLKFQQGSPEEGFNGVTLESLLAICADRLKGCQTGRFRSHHNAKALAHISLALEHLHDRTRATEPTL